MMREKRISRLSSRNHAQLPIDQSQRFIFANCDFTGLFNFSLACIGCLICNFAQLPFGFVRLGSLDFGLLTVASSNHLRFLILQKKIQDLSFSLILI
ncbi:hypothetical protein L1887_21406 [Cichorium endivia]|nr:hypothetical protein L1887_21406 [Cichorium endivia]